MSTREEFNALAEELKQLFANYKSSASWRTELENVLFDNVEELIAAAAHAATRMTPEEHRQNYITRTEHQERMEAALKHRDLIIALKHRDLLIALKRRDEGVIRDWLRNNMIFYNTEEGSSPVLASTAKRIWYHATDDVDSYPFDAVIDAARQAQEGEKG